MIILIELLEHLERILIAFAACLAAYRSLQTRRKVEEVKRELILNPEKSATAVVEKLNGSTEAIKKALNTPHSDPSK